MNKQVFTVIEVALIAGLIVVVLYWGGVFEPKPVPSPTAFPLPTIAIRTPIPEPTTTLPPETPSPTPLPTFAVPTLIEPSGLIAFNALDGLTHEIYVIDVGEGLPSNTPRNLTNNPADDYLLSWSPDGSRIAFFSTRTDWLELYVMDADGSNVVQLTDTKESQTAFYAPVTWSPDGKFLLAARRSPWAVPRSFDTTEVDAIFVDGSGSTNVFGIASWLSGLALSPDGYYMAMYAQGEQGYGVYTWKLNDTGLFESGFISNCSQFTWLPNSTRLTCNFNNSNFTINVDGTDKQALSPFAIHNFATALVWSPNGEALLIAEVKFEGASAAGVLHVSVVLRDGTIHVLSNNSDLFTDQSTGWSWAPNSQWVAFSSDRFGQKDIFAMNIYNPSDIRQLTGTFSGNSFAPQWQP